MDDKAEVSLCWVERCCKPLRVETTFSISIGIIFNCCHTMYWANHRYRTLTHTNLHRAEINHTQRVLGSSWQWNIDYDTLSCQSHNIDWCRGCICICICNCDCVCCCICACVCCCSDKSSDSTLSLRRNKMQNESTTGYWLPHLPRSLSISQPPWPPLARGRTWHSSICFINATCSRAMATLSACA